MYLGLTYAGPALYIGVNYIRSLDHHVLELSSAEGHQHVLRLHNCTWGRLYDPGATICTKVHQLPEPATPGSTSLGFSTCIWKSRFWPGTCNSAHHLLGSNFFYLGSATTRSATVHVIACESGG